MKQSILSSFFIMVLLLLVSPVQAEIMGDYLSYAACIDCHEEIVSGWQTTPHAHAFETLKKQGEEKQTIAECVRCHVVAFEKDGGYIDMALTPELKDVQCEVCHGPGRRHVEADGEPDEILVQPDESLCRSCHTEGQDKNFNYAVKKEFVHSAGLATVKGSSETGQDEGKLWADVQNVAFGNMVEGAVARKKVQLKNIGNAPLKITNVTTS